MDFTEEAKVLGFSDAAVMDTDNLVFMPEYRVFCEENACGNYDKNPACPPESGTVEEMKARALKYEKTLVLQTTQDSLMDYKKAKLFHNKLTEKLSEKMKEAGKTDILIMSAGPYKHNSCMSAYCVNAQKMADAVNMLCWTDDGKIDLADFLDENVFKGNEGSTLAPEAEGVKGFDAFMNRYMKGLGIERAAVESRIW